MKKIKLFTHTDLDGIGCYIVVCNMFGKNNIDVEYCDYDVINEKIENFMQSSEKFNYDAILITDISVNEEVAKIIDSYSKLIEIKLLDHHSTAIWLNKYEWACVEEVDKYNNKTSGTELTFKYLFDGYTISGWFKKLVQDITLYDTWRWMNDFKTPYIQSKKLNDLYYLLGRELFIEEMLKFKTIDDFETLLNVENNRIERIIDTKRKQLKISNIKDINGNIRTFGYVFSESNSSEIGNTLCRENKNLDFVAILDICNKGVSLRSILPESELHLGKDIARIFDGGGHAQASGCKLKGFWIDLTINYLNESI